MIIHKLDTQKDWSFGHGKSDILRDDNAIMLNIDTRLHEWVGDCFFATNNGVDWYNGLDRGMKPYLDSRIQDVIAESFGVVQILDYTSVLDNQTRKLTITYNITTINSQSVQNSIEVNG